MAYSKCVACGRAVAKVRVVAIDTDPFRFMPEALQGPMRLGFFCPHEGCRAELRGPGGDPTGGSKFLRDRERL